MDSPPSPTLKELITELLGPDLIEATSILGTPVITIYPVSIVRALTLLRDHKKYHFHQLVDITAIDYPSDTQRFQIVYNLLSLTMNTRLRIRLRVDSKTDVPSVTGVFQAASWYEREIWDLFGVHFSDHPDLRRILTDYDFSGHPLRKDFPLSGFTQVVYDPSQERVVHEPVSLDQNYRNFDFQSPWEGILSKFNPEKLS